MKKILFVIARYNDYRQEIFDKIISPRNKLYCEKHGYKYVEIRNNHKLPLFSRNSDVTWCKFTIVKELIDNNIVNDGDIITHLDADIYIYNLEKSLVSERSFTYAIDTGNTHCMGWYSLIINEWSKKMIYTLLDEKRHDKMSSEFVYHDGLNSNFSYMYQGKEQGAWYVMAGIKCHSNTPFNQLPNNGWHSYVTDNTVYSLEELYENVEIFPLEYNITELEGESDCRWNIYKWTRPKNEVVLRHFAGGQNWNNIKNWI